MVSQSYALCVRACVCLCVWGASYATIGWSLNSLLRYARVHLYAGQTLLSGDLLGKITAWTQFWMCHDQTNGDKQQLLTSHAWALANCRIYSSWRWRCHTRPFFGICEFSRFRNYLLANRNQPDALQIASLVLIVVVCEQHRPPVEGFACKVACCLLTSENTVEFAETGTVKWLFDYHRRHL